MARLNRRAEAQKLYTHEGGRAYPHMTAEQALRRSVMACFLWEREFYEDGLEIAQRISELSRQVKPAFLASLAIEAREEGKLRHVPLLLLRELVRTGAGSSLVSDTIERVIQRVDEMPELLALYWATNNGRKTLSAQLKKGLARAFLKFDTYQLAKYDRPTAVKLRDVLFLSHAKVRTEEQAESWAALVDRNRRLEAPDTWEVALSGGADKKETFTRLLETKKLGYLALLRNLRNMHEAGVERTLVEAAILERRGAQRVLPFRYFSASLAAPSYERALDKALIEAVKDAPSYDGETLVLVDVSGSMNAPVSGKSQVQRAHAAAMLGAMVKGNVRCFAFGTDVAEVPHRLGMAGVDAFQRANVGHGTNIGGAVKFAEATYPNAERIIVITDEQSHDNVADPKASKAYVINVASAKNGVGYGRWTHIDGFSENVLRFIAEYEKGAD